MIPNTTLKMAQPSDFNSRLNEERDVRVEDYLNDKLQTSADLDNLDSLLENVKNQQKLLREQASIHQESSLGYTDLQQLLEAERSLDIATKAEREHSTSLWKQAHEFNQQQADIDRRLLIVTQSETSDDAVRKFDSSMEELRRLDIANEYVGLLTEVDRLRCENICTKITSNLTLDSVTRSERVLERLHKPRCNLTSNCRKSLLRSSKLNQLLKELHPT